MPKQHSYRTLMNERREAQDIISILSGFRLGIQAGEHQDRAAVLVCVSVFEQVLEDAIWEQAAPQAQNERRRFFGESGVASSLADKILLAFVLGIIGPKTRNDLDQIRQIRNVFAHAKRHIDFQNANIVRMCSFNIAETDVWRRIVGKATLTQRETFVLAIQIIAEAFLAPTDELGEVRSS